MVGHDRGIGNEHHRVELRHRHLHAAELPRRDEIFGVGEGRAHADGAGRLVIGIVDEVDLAFHGPVGLVHELGLHHHRIAARRRDLSPFNEALIGHAVGLADIEEEVDGIERDDGGEQRGVAGNAADHEIADAELVAAGAAGDRRRHPRIVEIELRLVESGDGGIAGRRRRVHLRDALVVGLLRGVALFPELGGAGELGLGKIEIGVGLGEIGLGRFERELEGLRLDDEEQIALLDGLAVDEIDGFEIAADARAHVDEIDRLELPGEVLRLDELPDQGLGHGDLRRRRRGCRLLSALEERQFLPEAPIIIEQPRETRGKQQEKDAAETSARPGRRLALAWRRGGHGFLVRSRSRAWSRLRLSRQTCRGVGRYCHSVARSWFKSYAKKRGRVRPRFF